MSGGGIMKALNTVVNPLKQIGGDITGTRAARQNAQAIQEQTAAQEQTYQQELQTAQNQNTLDSQADTANVASVTSGGTAQDSDDALTAQTKKNRAALISSSLGL